MELSQDKSLALLGYYQNYPLLWNPRDEFYYNNLKKEDAWGEISSLMQISKDECRKKIESLKGSYRREKTKMKKTNTTGTGTVGGYKSKWFAFNAMAFLDEKTEPRETIYAWERDDNEVKLEYDEGKMDVNSTNIDQILKSAKTQTPSTIHRHRNPIELVEAELNMNGMPLNNNQQEEDECDLYGKLLAKKLRKLSYHRRLKFMHEIDGMFISKLSANTVMSPSSPTADHISSGSTSHSCSEQE